MNKAADDAPGQRPPAPPGPVETPGHTLPPGTRIHDYRIDRVLGEGGFGIVYLATDVALERQVAIKEYLPSSMAARAGQSMTVLVKSPGHQETFNIGLRSFVNEARLLAHFDHPALLKVHQFWEQNGTAYMAMPYYQGQTLKEALARLGRLPTEKEVRAWLMPLLDALEVLHKEHCYHRDIAPDNILLTEQGPLLLDFGAARRVIGDLTHALTAMLKPGFAPIEQYGDMPGVTQGPWTDIFALASVLYAAISGRRTVASVERLLSDELRPLATVAAGRCGNAFLAAIDRALAVHPKDRPQSIAEFRALLTVDDTQVIDLFDHGVDTSDATTLLLPDFDPTQPLPRTPAPPPPQPPAQPPAAVSPQRPPPPSSLSPSPSPSSPPLPTSPAAPVQPLPPPPRAAAAPPAPARRGLLLGLGGLAAAALAAWGGYQWLDRPAAPPPPAPAPAPASNVSAAPAAVSSSPQPEPAASAASTASAPPPPASAAAPVPTPASEAPASTPAAPSATPPAPHVRREATAPAAVATKGSKCSDILQKASLEPLSAAETAYLKKECR